ncbi:Ribulose bisphosphate carboxylase large chain [Planctomycetales bacterium 10988]|nr:Ribulose bisphosphate carboxylase large chain [Planctomycetales bacterium 10988]
MWIEVDYQFPEHLDAAKQAKVLAIGQTAGTWDERFAAQAEALQQHLGEPGELVRNEDGTQVATVCYPLMNVEGDIASLLTMIFGKYSMAGPAKIVAIRLPKEYGTKPKFGIKGLRELTGVSGRPFVMAILKPAFGLKPEQHAKIVREVAAAGLDFLKDDEILVETETSPVQERLAACREAIQAAKSETGREMLYAVNLTGRADELQQKARELVKLGANALLFNVLAYGWSVMESLAADPEIDVPIFFHPALAGAICAAPDYGFRYSVLLGTLAARSGADAVLYPASYGSLPFEASEEAGIRTALRKRNVMPVPSAGIHPGVVPQVLADYGTDVVLNAGTGIMDHPLGPGAGVKSFFEALDRCQAGLPMTVDSVEEGPLKEALRKWGGSA